jgi:PIN domain nuclease of toxin-antitoxin system
VRLLLDTHIFLWWLAGDESVSESARAAILEEGSNAIFISAASTWEIATRHRLGKLNGVNAIAADLPGAIESQGFLGLSITTRHGQFAGALPGPHRDPFDRMLIAQSISEDLVLVSNERAFDA